MAANKKAQAKQKKKVPKTRRQGKKRGAASSRAGHVVDHEQVMRICSVSNPFCPEAKTGKWPDNTHVKSNTWSIDGNVYGVTSNASGDGSVLFLPQFGYQLVGPTTVVANAVTYPTTASIIGGITLPANVSRFRLTSWGLRLTVATPSMTTQGYLQVRLFSPKVYGTLLTMDKGTRACDFAYDMPLNRLIGKDVCVIPMPLGDDAHVWRAAPSGTTNFHNTDNIGWQAINIGTAGAIASTEVVRITAYYNYELVFDDGDAVSAYATPPPKNEMVVREANAGVLQRLGNIIEGGAQTVDKIVKSTAFRYGAALAVSLSSKNPNAGMMMIANGPAREMD